MLFVRKPTTVVVESDPLARAEAERLAEERGKATGMATGLGILALIIVVLLVGYFAWYAPVNGAQAQDNTGPQVVHDTQVTEKPATTPPPTIINNPPAQPPVVIHQDRVVPASPPTEVHGSVATDAGGESNGAGTATSTGTTSGQ